VEALSCKNTTKPKTQEGFWRTLEPFREPTLKCVCLDALFLSCDASFLN